MAADLNDELHQCSVVAECRLSDIAFVFSEQQFKKANQMGWLFHYTRFFIVWSEKFH